RFLRQPVGQEADQAGGPAAGATGHAPRRAQARAGRAGRGAGAAAAAILLGRLRPLRRLALSTGSRSRGIWGEGGVSGWHAAPSLETWESARIRLNCRTKR